MRRLFTFYFFASLLFLFTTSQAQEVKTKTKANKTKVKDLSRTAMDTTGKSTTSTAGMQSDFSTLANTSWTTYFGDPVNDTLILHYAVDSSSVQSKTTGMTLISSVYKVHRDTLTFHDLSGVHACPSDQVGIYRINVTGDVLRLDLIKDDCDGRAGALKEINWQRFKQTSAQ